MTGGRKKNKYPAEKLQFNVPAGTKEDLDYLIDEKYGSNEGEVAAYLIKRGLDDLRRAQILKTKGQR